MTLKRYWLGSDEVVSLRQEDFGNQDDLLGNRGRDQLRGVEDHHTREGLPLRGCGLLPVSNQLEPRNMPDYTELLHRWAEDSQRDDQVPRLSQEGLFLQLAPPEHV